MIRPHNLEDEIVIIGENLIQFGTILRVITKGILRVFRIDNFSEDTESEILKRF